jgi:hypothetical protein
MLANLVPDFISRFNEKAKQEMSSGFWKPEYFTTWIFNSQSEVHSRVHATIAQVLHELGLKVEVERSFNSGKLARFRPDVSVYRDNKLSGIVEYESTNSSDARFYDFNREACSLRHLEKSRDIGIPCWIFISTLPKAPVEKTKWYSYEFKKSDPEFSRLIASPYNFYFPRYVFETEKVITRNNIKAKVCLLNIDENRLVSEKEF